MISLNDIKDISFRKSGIGGYKPEDVDTFIDEVIVSYEKLVKRNKELDDEVSFLSEKVDKYKADEEFIRGALINAQKLSDASIREAKHKAEVIITDAEHKAQCMLSDTERNISDKIREYENLKKEISTFRQKLLDMYKEHLQLIDAFPSAEEITKEKTSNQEDTQKKVEKTEQKSEKTDKSSSVTSNIEFKFSMPQESSFKLESTEEKLKFGEKYNISEDKEESTVGLFER